MARAKKTKVEAPPPVVTGAVSTPIPQRVVEPEVESAYTNAELRAFIDYGLATVPLLGDVNVKYCAALQHCIKDGMSDRLVEVYVRGKDLVVEVRSGRRIEKVVLPGIA